jgi:hypothetical protein
MEDSDKRVHTRSQYFLIKDQGEAVPIYAFRDANDVAAIPALVVAFAPAKNPQREWSNVLSGAPHHVLRCVLHPT